MSKKTLLESMTIALRNVSYKAEPWLTKLACDEEVLFVIRRVRIE